MLTYRCLIKLTSAKGRGSGLVVSLLTFYSVAPSLNPAEASLLFSFKRFEKNENKLKSSVLTN